MQDSVCEVLSMRMTYRSPGVRAGENAAAEAAPIAPLARLAASTTCHGTVLPTQQLRQCSLKSDTGQSSSYPEC